MSKETQRQEDVDRRWKQVADNGLPTDFFEDNEPVIREMLIRGWDDGWAAAQAGKAVDYPVAGEGVLIVPRGTHLTKVTLRHR